MTVLQGDLDEGSEKCMVSLDFGAAFDHVNHRALIHKLRSLGIGGSFIIILDEFLLSSSRSLVHQDPSRTTCFASLV